MDWKGILDRALVKGHIDRLELKTIENEVVSCQELRDDLLHAAVVRRLAVLGKLTPEDREFLQRFDHRPKDATESETWDDPDTLSTAERPSKHEDFSSTQPLTEGERRSIQSAKEGLGELPFLENYRMETKVGKGGMGDVYKAYDRRLDRTVAIKVLRHLGRKSFERFLREAKSQAKVEHENICKVYEADVVGGIPYIIMQFIHGGTLKDLANRLTLRQKLLVLRDVARAVHTAHGFGIIHRDLKPANIMMRQIDPDTWKPYVMDFGLARSQTEPGVTATGSLLGTVRFMSPEQARGQTRSLDHRTDIYSLGATLYYTIAGRSPVDGSNFGEILAKLTRENPLPLRHFDPTLPPDLDFIVSKCLAKKPHHRYPSARALADDLNRLVSGEPISARRPTFGYLLGKKIRKNKIASWAIGAAICVILGSAAWTGVTLWRANTRAQLARDFGRKVERIDAVARYAHMLPKHDILVEYRYIEDMMAQIKQQMRSVGKLGEGSGHYALGRGFLALGNNETALNHLEKAWAASYRDEEVAYALGLVRARLYLLESRNLDGIRDPELRSAKKRDIERRHRDPSLAYLKLATQSGFESPQFVESLIAFQERRFEAAHLKADQAFARTPWLYEAVKLKGNINVLHGSEKVFKGELNEAVALFREAERHYEQALVIAGSDPDIYLRMADLWQLFMISEIYSTGGDIEQYKNRAVAACEAALAIHGRKAEAHRLLVEITMRWNEYLFHRGSPSPDSLNRALEYAQRALALNPDDGESLDALGTASVWLGIHLEKKGEDPTDWFKKAEAAYLEALARMPAIKTHIKLGLTYQHFSTYAVHLGRSPIKFAEKAVHQFEQALNLDPRDTNAIVNLGNTHFILAQGQWLRGHDPESHFKQAIARMRRVLELNPKHTFSRANLGSFLEHLSRFYMSFGKDPIPMLAEAEEAIAQCAETHKNYYQVYEIFASVLASRATWEAHLGRDPRPWVDRAIEACEAALTIDPNSVKARVEGARAWRVAKGWSARQGKPYSLKPANEWLRQGLQLHPGEGSLLQASAKNRLLTAYLLSSRKTFANSQLKKAIESLKGAMVHKAGLPETHCLLAKAHFLSGLVNRRKQDFEKSRFALRAAQELNPSMPEAKALWAVLALVQPDESKGTHAVSTATLGEIIEEHPLLDFWYGGLLREKLAAL